MKAWPWVALALVAGCKSGSKANEAPTVANATTVVNVPKAEVAGVFAAVDGKPPPFLVIVDEAGDTHVNWTAKWADIATKDLRKGAKTAPLEAIYKLTREASLLGKSPAEAMAWWDDPKYGELSTEDPPPPEEEETGGTGTAMALEEGKMGKRDSDRAEAQYRMHKDASDAELAARKVMGPRGPAMAFAPLEPDGHGDPHRLARTAGEVMTDGKLPEHAVVIVASPRAKAQKVIDALVELEGPLAVAHHGTVSPLRLDFVHERDSAGWGTIGTLELQWLEARVSTNGIAVEAPPEAVIEVAWPNGSALPAAKLTAALAKARKSRDLHALAPVDILVDAGIDAQRLVDLVVALDRSGVRMIGFGDAPNADEAARRGKRNPTVRVGQPVALGDLDKNDIRKVVREAQPKMVACYTEALAKDASISGTVMTKFFVTPKGTVATSEASGVDPELAKCIAGVIKTLVFPKPRGGGGVEVSYPFTMRP